MTDKCVYCRCRAATERDHVVPRELFPKPRPQLITVPACEECNRGYSKDEEFFRLIVTGDVRVVYRSDDARSLLEGPVLRSLERSPGLRNLLLDNVVGLVPVNLDGTGSQDSFAIEYDVERLKRVIEKMVLGLFYHEFSMYVPLDHRVLPRVSHDPRRMPEELNRWITRGNVRAIGREFGYLFRRFKNSEYASIWYLCFYDAWFAAATIRSPDS
ncbi:MAG TPA: hypothetical protein VM118_01830 [Acidobacteriota bacterium]|nr:hypothetical protein [Acidobacteriota bacterium]